MKKNETQIVTKETLTPTKSESFLPVQRELTTEELKEESQIYFKSGLAPAHLKNWEAVFVAKSWAQGLGIHTTLGIRDIYVIDNIPSLKTEAALAIVLARGFVEYSEQYYEGTEGTDDFTAVFKVKRKGNSEHISKFSVKDAKTAGLWGKKTKTNQPTSWVLYPKLMLMYRAVGFALRQIFPDALRGARLQEEMADYQQFEIISDNSTQDNVNNVTLQNKKTFNGGNKTINLLNDEPPE